MQPGIILWDKEYISPSLSAVSFPGRWPCNMPGYEVVFKDDFPADSRLAGIETEESAERESTVDINGVTSERGTDIPFTRACCRSIAILESRLPTVVKEDACVCGEGAGTGTLSVVLETESCG